MKLEKFGSFELPATSIETLLRLAKLRQSDVFVDLGTGTGPVVIRAIELSNVKMVLQSMMYTTTTDESSKNAES